MFKSLPLSALITLALLTGCGSGGGGDHRHLGPQSFVVNVTPISTNQSGRSFDIGRFELNLADQFRTTLVAPVGSYTVPSEERVHTITGTFVTSDLTFTQVEYHLLHMGKDVASTQVPVGVEVTINVDRKILGGNAENGRFRLIVFPSPQDLPTGSVHFDVKEMDTTLGVINRPFALPVVNLNAAGFAGVDASVRAENVDSVQDTSVANELTLDRSTYETTNPNGVDWIDHSGNIQSFVTDFVGHVVLEIDGVEMDRVWYDSSNPTPIAYKLFTFGEGLEDSQPRLEIIKLIPAAGRTFKSGDEFVPFRIGFGTNRGYDDFRVARTPIRAQ